MPIPKPGDTCRSGSDTYQIVKELNRGAFAIAYRARSQRSSGDVFLKRYTSPKISVAWFEDFVAHQQELKRRVSSTPSVQQNCYRFVEFFKGEDRHFYQVFEFVEGGHPLTEFIAAMAARRDAVPWEKRVSFARVMMLGIASLHSQKIVHTDLKPDNLLLIPNPHMPGDFLLRVIDLDWAIFSDRRAPWHGEIGYVGTPGYQSPEHLRGEVPTEASDVFTCGLILSELLANHHPFAGKGEYEHALAAGDFARFRAAQPIPRVADMAALEALVDRCFDRDSHHRPTSAEIKDALRGLPIAASAARPAPPHRPPPPAAPAKADSSLRTRDGAITLLLDDRVVLTVNIDTDVGRAHVKPHSPDAQFVSDPQFRLFRDGSRWMVAHAPGAQNQTLVDGQPLSTPVALASGMRIAVGNAAKAIEKLPLVVQFT